jgi:large subunit ribosomal protein L22
MNQSLTYLKNLKISPKKLRFYLASVKKMAPNESLKFLFYGKQKANAILYKSIKSAVDNAVLALKTTPDLLRFKLLTIEEGYKLKRYKPGSRGNMKPIKRRMSHIKIILETRKVEQPAIEVKKETKLEIKKTTSAKATVVKEKKNGTKS